MCRDGALAASRAGHVGSEHRVDMRPWSSVRRSGAVGVSAGVAQAAVGSRREKRANVQEDRRRHRRAIRPSACPDRVGGAQGPHGTAE
jgi:hypothetical protein